jgi:hypothetical protein
LNLAWGSNSVVSEARLSKDQNIPFKSYFIKVLHNRRREKDVRIRNEGISMLKKVALPTP